MTKQVKLPASLSPPRAEWAPHREPVPSLGALGLGKDTPGSIAGAHGVGALCAPPHLCQLCPRQGWMRVFQDPFVQGLDTYPRPRPVTVALFHSSGCTRPIKDGLIGRQAGADIAGRLSFRDESSAVHRDCFGAVGKRVTPAESARRAKTETESRRANRFRHADASTRRNRRSFAVARRQFTAASADVALCIFGPWSGDEPRKAKETEVPPGLHAPVRVRHRDDAHKLGFGNHFCCRRRSDALVDDCFMDPVAGGGDTAMFFGTRLRPFSLPSCSQLRMSQTCFLPRTRFRPTGTQDRPVSPVHLHARNSRNWSARRALSLTD